MGKQEFDNYLSTRSIKPGQLPEQLIDWKEEQKDWLLRLEELYNNVQTWLADYQSSGLVQVVFRPIQLFEDGIGVYETMEAEIGVGGVIAKLIPIGTALVGVKGRVDLEGPCGTVRFVLAHKEATRPQIAFRHRIYSSRQEEAQVQQFWRERGLEALLADDWAWKVSTNPPHISYTDLNQDTFLGSLLEVVSEQEAN